MFTMRAASRGCPLGFLTALTCCALLGCGGAQEYRPPPLAGVVLWQDGTEPRELEGGTVEFEADGSIVAKAELTADGRFRLETALRAGTYRVRVTPPPGAANPRVLDPRFESFDKSGLTFTSSSQPQQVTLKVRKPGAAAGRP